jgi:hypothetical protein
MNNTFTHLIYIPISGVGLYSSFRDENWLRYRIEIFKHYTLNSLLNQTNKNFILWLSFEPRWYNNTLILELENYIKQTGMAAFMSFEGLMYWDDKFNNNLISKGKNILRMVRHWIRTKGKVPLSSIREVFHNKNKTLIERLNGPLRAILKNIPKVDWIYFTRIDSDDMFHKNAVSEIQSRVPFEGALVFKRGYIYNKKTNKLAQWTPKTTPPFYTIIFPYDTFFNPTRYLEYYGKWKSHEDTTKVFSYRELSDFSYCILVHNTQSQISTIWNHPFRGLEIYSMRKDDILKNFVNHNASNKEAK